jgi:hypothetical protein
MKSLAVLALLVAAAAATPYSSATAADVGISIDISQPGVYGRIDIGRFPQPQLVVQRPVIIGRPALPRQEPVYLWVPPGHRKDWRRHCAEYRACGLPVYFVQDRWYGEHVQPHARDHDGRGDGRSDERHSDRREEGRGHGDRHPD